MYVCIYMISTVPLMETLLVYIFSDSDILFLTSTLSLFSEFL